MNGLNLLEALEDRRLFSAAVNWAAIKTIGATSGLHAAALSDQPSVLAPTSPDVTQLKNARRDLTITVALNLPHGAINYATLNSQNVRLYELNADGSRGPKVSTGLGQTSGGGDTISLTPNSPLKANTGYLFEINASYVPTQSLLKDVASPANVFQPYSLKFTTGTEISIATPDINFSQQDAGAGVNAPWTATTVGPDHKLYAATMRGDIYRWTIGSDGTLSGRQQITTVRDSNAGQNRIITGITFDPSSTSSDLKLWVSHGEYKLGTTATTGPGVENQADNYSGSISLLSDANLGHYKDYIIDIPRSVKDHMNNQISFDSAGNMYFVIAAMNAMGQADQTWGLRDENILSAAMIKVDMTKLNNEVTNSSAVDLSDTAGYDPTDPANAVNIYATGIRNAYDMVFHSNGHLYSAINGSSAGGNTPGHGSVPGLTNVPQVEDDALLDVHQGKYYGHPNPSRNEYVLDGGNPTSGVDPYEFAVNTKYGPTRLYAVGTQPDSNYQQPAYDLGRNVSPDGMIEYKGSFAGIGNLLNGYLLIARYNNGSDIVAIKPNADGTISKSNIQTRITGLANDATSDLLQKPLDLVEDTTNGNLYAVTMPDENQNTGKIVLMKPKAVDAAADATTRNTTNPHRLSLYVAPGNRKGVTDTVTVTNTGSTTLVIDVSATKITRNRKNFVVLDFPKDDISILPGESHVFQVRGVMARGQTEEQFGNLAFAINDPHNRYEVAYLRALNVFDPFPASASAQKASLASIVQKNMVTTAFSASSGTTETGSLLKDILDS